MSVYAKQVPVAFLLLGLLSLPPALVAAAVVVETPWVREAPPAATVLAAYMVLKNTGDSARTITGISSPDFRAAEIHRSVVEDGVARMLPVGQLQLPPRESIALEPGGLHLMLFDPKRSLRAGDSVLLVIHGSDGESLRVKAPVVRKTGDEQDHSRHH